MDHGRQLAKGTPQELTTRAEGLTDRARPRPGEPARDMQAQLLDAPDLVADAIPQVGAVRLICQPGVDVRDVKKSLVPRDIQPRKAELEDAFMLLLRQEADPSAPAPLPMATVATKDTGPVIVVRDLVRKFGDFTAVASTSFDVKRGEIFGLLGPNGAGKTTTFRMLCGLLPATSGELQVAGLNLRIARAQARGRIGYVAQKFALYGNLTVRENLEFFGGAYGLRGRALKARINAVVAQFDLDPEAQTGPLPAGYKQRLAMATGLLHEPDILFLDEPTSGIDPLARRGFWRSITALSQDRHFRRHRASLS